MADLPTKMKGAQLVGHGGPEALVFSFSLFASFFCLKTAYHQVWNKEIPLPVPGPGEVLTRVLAAGVNNTDINTRVGWYSKQVTTATTTTTEEEVKEGGWSGGLNFPRIQGSDLCGEVVQVGKGVTQFKIGQRVTCATNQPIPTPSEPTKYQALGSEYDGSFAEYCVVPESQLFDVTDSPLSHIQIAAAPCAYGTALNLLTRARVGEGDKVLVTGASGGVGLAVVEMAVLKGGEVTGVALEAKHQVVLGKGAKCVLGRDDVPEEKSYNVVIDVVGGPNFPDLINSLKPAGRYAVSGAVAGPIVSADLRTFYLNDLTFYGCTYTPREVFAELVGFLNKGKVSPLVSHTYPMRDIGKAQEDFVEKKFPGKLVLTPDEMSPL